MRIRADARRTLPSTMYRTPRSLEIERTSRDFPLYEKEECRELTNSPGTLDKSVIRSSAKPSTKYSCSGSLLIFVKGRTAIAAFRNLSDLGWVASGWTRGGFGSRHTR